MAFGKYLYEIPYGVTMKIVASMDTDRSWEMLAGEIGYNFDKIRTFELEYQRYTGSPTKSLLWDWGSRNVTVKDLYDKLKLLNRIREMQILDDYVKSSKEVVYKKESKPVNTEPPDQHMGPSSLQPPARPVATLSSINVDDLPKPSALRRLPSESSTENEVNFNQPKSLSSKPMVSSKVVADVSDKDKKYDDKVIPGTKKESSNFADSSLSDSRNSSSQSSRQTSSNSVSKASESTDSSSIDFSLLEKTDPEKAFESLKTCMKNENLTFTDAVALMGTPFFEYKELYEATDGFSPRHKLGSGAFGTVFYGYLRCSKCAIKRLEDNAGSKKSENSAQLRSELGALLRYRHENIVNLYGYAIDGPALCLIYQHMTNGSLEDRLQCKDGTPPLGWERRIAIASGAASGLQHLHNFGEKPLVHGDIKSANILLDKHFEAKIGDLGQAQHANSGAMTGKFTHITQKSMSSKIYGTKAYLAPELLRGGGNISVKSDVYAFGVVLLEVCSGEKPHDEKREGTNKFLTSYFNELQDEAKDDEVKLCKLFRDKRAGDCQETFVMELIKCASNAVKDKKKDRIEMQKLLHHLESVEESWRNAETSSSDISSISQSVRSDHLSHMSGQDCSVQVMAGNPGDKSLQYIQQGSGKAPPSPIDYFKVSGSDMPEAFRLAQLYDQQRGKKLDSSEMFPESLRLQMMVDARKEGQSLDFDEIAAIKAQNKQQEDQQDLSLEDFSCDPKKVKEIKKFDAQLNCGTTSPASLDSDPKKLEALKQFDRNQRMIREPDEYSEPDTDKEKLEQMNSFDRENSTDSMPSGLLFGNDGNMPPSKSDQVQVDQAGPQPQQCTIVEACVPVGQNVLPQAYISPSVTSNINLKQSQYTSMPRQGHLSVGQGVPPPSCHSLPGQRVMSQTSASTSQERFHNSPGSGMSGVQNIFMGGQQGLLGKNVGTVSGHPQVLSGHPSRFPSGQFVAPSKMSPEFKIVYDQNRVPSGENLSSDSCYFGHDTHPTIVHSDLYHQRHQNIQSTNSHSVRRSLPVLEVCEDSTPKANQRLQSTNPGVFCDTTSQNVIYSSAPLGTHSLPHQSSSLYKGAPFEVVEESRASSYTDGSTVTLRSNLGQLKKVAALRQSEGFQYTGHSPYEEGHGSLEDSSAPNTENSFQGSGHIAEGQGHSEDENSMNVPVESGRGKISKMNTFFSNYEKLLAEECEQMDDDPNTAEEEMSRQLEAVEVIEDSRVPQEADDNLDDSVTDINV